MPKPNKEPVCPMKGFLEVHSSMNLLLLLALLFQLPRLAFAQTGGTHFSPLPHHKESPFDRPTAIIMVVVVGVFFFFGYLCVYARQRTGQRAARNINRTALAGHAGSLVSPPHGLSTEAIKTFPTFQYSTIKNLKIGNRALECAVCLNEFEDDETLRLLPKCNHVFHPDCIDSWLTAHTTCPVCRANLVPEPGESFLAQVRALDPDRGSPEPGNRSPNSDQPENQESALIGDDQITAARSPPILRSPISRSTGLRSTGLFPKSHSTGHSLVQPGEDCERFTLRLPEEVRRQLLNTTLERATSCEVVFPRMKSSKKGFLSRSAGNSFNYERFKREGQANRWGISMTPPFTMKSASTRSQKGGGSDEGGRSGSKSVFKLAKSPVNRLLSGSGNVSERSFDRLRPDTQV